MSQARRLFVALVVVAVVVLSASAADAGGVSPGPDPVGRPDQPVAGQYIVTLRDSSSSIPGAADLLARLHGGLVLRTFQSAIQGFTVRMSDAQARALASDPRVAAVEQDGYVHALDTTQTSTRRRGASTASTSATSRATTRTPTRTTAPACTPTSSTPASRHRTPTSADAHRSASTRSVTGRTGRTATATARTSPARSAARRTASRRTCSSSRSGCSTAAGPAPTRR